MAGDTATVQVERDGVSMVLEISVLAVEGAGATAIGASSAARSPWSSKGFSWDDAWVLRYTDRGHYIAVVAAGRKVTIWNDDLTAAEEFDVPEGADPRLFTWNKVCELGWHTCTPNDAFPEGSL